MSLAIFKTDSITPNLAEAKIGLAWRYGFKQDKDGRIILGKCKKCGGVEREAHGHDFIIILNYEFWHDAKTTDKQRLALMDHELCHAAVQTDKEGDEISDTKGRYVYRCRKHDIEEFREIVERHGLYKSDLQAFAESIRQARATPLLNQDEVQFNGNTIPISHFLKAAKTSDDLAEKHAVAKKILGKEYEDFIGPLRDIARLLMKKKKMGVIESVLKIAKDMEAKDKPIPSEYLAAAAVDLIEEQTKDKTTGKKKAG